jgi:NADH:ubiquinone oxidoreductase subunit 5 (subunit L)/multisubunit Na+/H+ antiporter MnhA subunit
VVSLGVAVAGWFYAYSTQIRFKGQTSIANGRSNWLYVLFWNKGYFDEIYDAYLVTPTIHFAHWLWRIVDIKFIDRFIHLIATYSVYFVGCLWTFVDIRWLDWKVGQVAGKFYTAEQSLQKIEFRTTQHQLLVMIFWLGGMTGLLYILV